jgi:hypothetical protein
MTTSTNYTQISYATETVEGVIDDPLDLLKLPTTGGAPSGDISTEKSETIRDDRMDDDLHVVDSNVGGEMNFEMAYAPYKPLITEMLRGDVVSASFSGDLTAVNATSEFTGTGLTTATNLAVGQIVAVRGFSDPTINRMYKITALSATSMEVYPAPPADETGASKTISASVVANGVNDPQTYTFLKSIGGIQNDAYFYYTGCVISEIMLSIESENRVTGSMTIVGREEEATETPHHVPAVDNPADQPPYTIMNATSDFDTVQLVGLGGSACFKKMDLKLSNNSTAAKCIGTLGASDIADFGFEATADISMFFRDLAEYNAFKASNSFGIMVTAKDADGNEIGIHMPRCKFESLEPPIDGKDNFLMLDGSIRALADSTLGYAVSVSFADAA